jgi:CRISPR-associated protein Csy3
MATKKATTPESKKGTVLAVMRGINVSDAPMSSILGRGEPQPIPVMRHGIRGTQNVAKKKEDKEVSEKKEARESNKVSNIQITETAKTSPDALGLHIRFSLQTTPLRKLVTACDQPEVRADIDRFLQTAETSEELMELCRRYARRIFSGSFLWRNLTLAQALNIEATCESKTVKVEGEQAFALAERGFTDYVEAELTLAQWLQRSFVTEASIGAGIEITAQVKFANAGAFEVYPSQVYVSNKPRGFARPLYKLNPISSAELMRLQPNEQNVETLMDSLVMGQAAIRDQKIGNAIRTIDTWYAEGNVPPIAVEPNGASLSANVFYRDVKSGKSFFDLLPRIKTLTQQLHTHASGMQPSPEAMFALAVFIRGGVFGDGKSE